MRSWWQLVSLAVLVGAGCAGTSQLRPRASIGELRESVVLFDATTAIQDDWQHLQFRGATEYRLRSVDAQVAICAVGHESASSLIRWVELDPSRCAVLEWAWQVDLVQPGADLRVKEREDVAASLFLLFGDPGFIADPQPVPTLRYVWTNERVSPETVVENPYLPKTVRSIVIESGTSKTGRWLIERRNVVEDFEKAFGYRPPDTIHAIALFTDNDQTKQPVEACYGWARALCAP